MKYQTLQSSEYFEILQGWNTSIHERAYILTISALHD